MQTALCVTLQSIPPEHNVNIAELVKRVDNLVNFIYNNYTLYIRI